jgi:Neuraminidase (sialidase)
MVVTKRWRGMRWTQAVSKTSDTDADGKAVWSWRPTLASSLRGLPLRRRWQTSPITGESAE